MTDNYNSIFDTYRRFDSIFDIYPDKFHTGAVYGYRKSDGTLLEFPCTLDVSRAVKDDKGRWIASGLGLKPAFVKYSDNLKRAAKRTGAKKAWIGDGFVESGNLKQVHMNNAIEEVRFLDNVTSIGNNAFSGYTGLTSIEIPDGITSIGCSAFEFCTGLTSITIPEGVTEIRDQAFWNCTNLANITLPGSITSIDHDYEFRMCSNLTNVIITIPKGVTSIGWGAFYRCTRLTSITIPDGVTSIEDYTFADCKGLTSITIPDSVTKIGKGAFSGCISLSEITIPKTLAVC